jgi:O-antigen ligase
VLVAPFALYRELAGTTVTLPKVVLLGVLLGTTTYPDWAKRLRQRPVPLLLGAIVLLFCATAVSAVHAGDRAATLRETLKIAEYAGFFIAAFLCYRLDANDRLAAAAVALAAIAVSLSALAQEIAGAPSVLCFGSSIVPRIAGVLEGPNQLAGYVEVAAATLGAWSLRKRSTLGDVALAVTMCAGILTFSRAGWIALAVIALTLVVAGGRDTIRALAPGVAGLAVGFLGAGAWALAARDPNVLRLSLDSSACTGGVGNRAELWPAAWRMWLRHPLFGVGAGNYELDLSEYGVTGVRTHANSWYLQSLAEGGAVLFATAVAFIGTAAFVLLDGARRAAASAVEGLRTTSPWIVAALAATFALALHQIVDDLVFYPKVAVPWFTLLGIATAALAAQRRAASP